MNMKKKLKERMKELGYTVKFAEMQNNAYMELYGEKWIQFSSESFPLLSQMRIDCDQINEMAVEDIELIIHYFKHHSKNKQNFLLIRLEGKYADGLKKKLLKRTFKTVSNQKILFYYLKKNGNIIHSHDAEAFDQLIDHILEIKNKLVEKEKQNPLVEVSMISALTYQIRLHDFVGNLTPTRRENEMYIDFGKRDGEKAMKKIRNHTDIETYIDAWFEEIEKSQRVKNILSPSKKFFDQWINMIKWDMEQTKKDEVYETLLAHFSPLEVESFSATCVKRKQTKTVLDYEEWLFQYEKKAVLVIKNPLNVHVFEKNDELEENVLEALLQVKKDKIKQKFKDIS